VPDDVGKGDPSIPTDLGQGGLNLVKDFWCGGHVKGHWSMVGLLVLIEPCVDNFFLLPKWKEVFHLHLTEVTDHFPSVIEGSIGSNLEFNPVSYIPGFKHHRGLSTRH
jgi:hypothetical protein